MEIADSNKIPGMIEPVEQQLLYETARTVSLSDNDAIVEFGTFFGRSTYCLAEGLADNPQRKDNNHLFAHDTFSCHENGGFAKHVYNFAKSGDIESLIDKNDEIISFLPIFNHYLSRHIDAGIVQAITSEINQSQPPEGSIALIHIDSPKFYREFKPVLYKFFPKLRVGSVVIFQDYFYHWSATLVAAVQVLLDQKVVEFKASAASSFVVEVVQKPSAETILELDLIIQNTPIPDLIDKAIVNCSNLTLDRKELFLPRLVLCKMQYLWEQNRPKAATEQLKNFMRVGGQINQSFFNDFLELLENEFSIKELYELDYRPE